MRPIVVLAHILIGGLFLTAGCAKLNFWKRADSSKTLAHGPCVGTVAPEIEGEDFEGKHVKLSDYRGKVVVVAFWASWCRPCMNMVPHERALVERFRDKPFVLLGVNNDEDPESALKAIRAQRMGWRSCRFDEHVNQRWNIECLPSVYVIDANGVLRYSMVSAASLEGAVGALVAEAERKK